MIRRPPKSKRTATFFPSPTLFRSTLVDSVNLEPGDMVLVDGGTTYNGDIIVRSGDRGAPGNPVTFRWNRSVGSTRPVLRGGTHTIKFQQSNHVAFDGFDVRGDRKSTRLNSST